MPTYSYRCTGCTNAFDIAQSFTDDSLTVCESCGGALRKVFNTIGVTFNGSGFYRTDSRASTGKKSPTGEKHSSDSGSGSSGSAKSSESTSTSSGSANSGTSSSSSSPQKQPATSTAS